MSDFYWDWVESIARSLEWEDRQKVAYAWDITGGQKLAQIPFDRVTGYTYDADTHCVGCTRNRFGNPDDPDRPAGWNLCAACKGRGAHGVGDEEPRLCANCRGSGLKFEEEGYPHDSEGNEVHPMFAGEDWDTPASCGSCQNSFCTTCGHVGVQREDRAECEACEGSGKAWDDEDEKCDHCDGEGYHDNVFECPNCRTKSRYDEDEGEMKYLGSKHRDKPEEFAVCPDCKGSGDGMAITGILFDPSDPKVPFKKEEEPGICSECKGSGLVKKEAQARPKRIKPEDQAAWDAEDLARLEAEEDMTGVLGRDCYLGNHSACKDPDCGCGHHSAITMSGACVDGDHAACKMVHGIDPDDCHCPEDHKQVTAHKEFTTCLDCGGTGHWSEETPYDERFVPRPGGSCFACNGSGLVDADDVQDCPACDGSGEYPPGTSCGYCYGHKVKWGNKDRTMPPGADKIGVTWGAPGHTIAATDYVFTNEGDAVTAAKQGPWNQKTKVRPICEHFPEKCRDELYAHIEDKGWYALGGKLKVWP